VSEKAPDVSNVEPKTPEETKQEPKKTVAKRSHKAKTSEIKTVEFNRKKSVHLSKKGYYFGLVPETNRNTISVDGVSLHIQTGRLEEQGNRDKIIVRQIGTVERLTEKQVENARASILRTGLRFRVPGRSPSKFPIGCDNPNDYPWEDREFPLGQFCYIQSVDFLDKTHGANSWRNKETKIETLIGRDETMGDGWKWPEQRPTVTKHKRSGLDLREIM